MGSGWAAFLQHSELICYVGVQIANLHNDENAMSGDEEVPGHIGQHPRFFDFKASMLQTKQEFCTSCIRLFAKRPILSVHDALQPLDMQKESPACKAERQEGKPF